MIRILKRREMFFVSENRSFYAQFDSVTIFLYSKIIQLFSIFSYIFVSIWILYFYNCTKTHIFEFWLHHMYIFLTLPPLYHIDFYA